MYAEKMLNNPTKDFDDSKQSNRYGYNLLAVSKVNPKFKNTLENMAKQYGIEVKKSLFDYFDYDIENDESYEDNDASNPDLFNSTSYKVAAALDSVFGC